MRRRTRTCRDTHNGTCHAFIYPFTYAPPSYLHATSAYPYYRAYPKQYPHSPADNI